MYGPRRVGRSGLLTLNRRGRMDSVKAAVVTGAGSGVGRAVALKLAQEGWSVALVGRREEALRQAVADAGARAAHPPPVVACGVGRPDDVDAVAPSALARFATVHGLV